MKKSLSKLLKEHRKLFSFNNGLANSPKNPDTYEYRTQKCGNWKTRRSIANQGRRVSRMIGEVL